MIDTSTNEKLTVWSDGKTLPLIMVPVTQMTDVQNVLNAHHIPYYIEENTISLDDEPEIAFFNLGREVDARAVQDLLDRQL